MFQRRATRGFSHYQNDVKIGGVKIGRKREHITVFKENGNAYIAALTGVQTKAGRQTKKQ